MSSQSAKVLAILCIFIAVAHVTTSTMVRLQRNDVASVADAVKYLQELDSIYSQIARPR